MSELSDRTDGVDRMDVLAHCRNALGQIAGEWHARRLPDGERFGCSCPEFAREALDAIPDQPEGVVDPEMPRVFFRDIEPDPGWEVRVFFPGDEVAIEPGTWVEYVPAPAEGAVDPCREALRELVRLKDGPRDDAYRAAKDAAWQAARDALGLDEEEAK